MRIFFFQVSDRQIRITLPFLFYLVIIDLYARNVSESEFAHFISIIRGGSVKRLFMRRQKSRRNEYFRAGISLRRGYKHFAVSDMRRIERSAEKNQKIVHK